MGCKMNKNICALLLFLLTCFPLLTSQKAIRDFPPLPPVNKTRSEVSIAIIGAGLAGLSAADKLINEYGFENVAIYEAKGRIGGRILPYEYGDNRIVDLGSWYILGTEGNPMYKLLLDLGGIDPESQRDGFGVVPQCKEENFDFSVKDKFFEWWDIIEDTLNDKQQGAWGQAVIQKFNQLLLSDNSLSKQEVNALVHLFFLSYQRETLLLYGSPDWDTLSVRQWANFEDFGGDPEIAVNSQGHAKLLDYFSDVLFGVINLNSEVTNIDWSEPDHVTLSVKDGSTVQADHVIVATSLGYLKQNEATLFNPPLPQSKKDVIKDIGYGNVEMLYLEFEGDFDFGPYEHLWTVDLSGFNCPKFTNPLSDIFISVTVPVWSDSLLAVWIAGPDPARLAEATGEQILDAAGEAMSAYFPGIPRVIRIIWSSWSTDPHFLGAYSYYSVDSEYTFSPQDLLAEPLASKQQLLIQFAGEATNSTRWGTTDAAITSGWREAERLSNIYPIFRIDEIQGLSDEFA